MQDTKRPEVQWQGVLLEVGVMREVEDHPNAVRLVEAYNEDKQYYLIMEVCGPTLCG
jgi:serine/threonine protein kinase